MSAGAAALHATPPAAPAPALGLAASHPDGRPPARPRGLPMPLCSWW